ncbi:hypothetical protein F5Y12DRAFT_751921 [Xylaria sp. FL1777]|nr:hypothetical protein F5Y12DRAFT_751921 [Xylaria sp. FL1777]
MGGASTCVCGATISCLVCSARTLDKSCCWTRASPLGLYTGIIAAVFYWSRGLLRGEEACWFHGLCCCLLCQVLVRGLWVRYHAQQHVCIGDFCIFVVTIGILLRT